MILSIEKMIEAMKRIEEIPIYNSLRVIFDYNALENSNIRLFPFSKHRSKRLRKKLIKRYGGEYRKQPCMWRVGDTIYAHPTFKTQLEYMINN